ncbi:hypothetical protein HDV06_000081 [Boothiomyces sp. JEL0866]|nr:hypothetical protein HDV06_000081 [Boothiomyces sp. JEL0866]
MDNIKGKVPKKVNEFNDFQYWSPPISRVDIDEPEEEPSKVDFSHWKSTYPTLKPYKQAEKKVPKLESSKADPPQPSATNVIVNSTNLSVVNQHITPVSQTNASAVVNNTVNNHHIRETRVTNNYISVNPVNITEAPKKEPNREPHVITTVTPVNIIHNHTVIVNNNVKQEVQPPFPARVNAYPSNYYSNIANTYSSPNVSFNNQADSNGFHRANQTPNNQMKFTDPSGPRSQITSSATNVSQYSNSTPRITQINIEPRTKQPALQGSGPAESQYSIKLSAKRKSEVGTVKSEARHSSTNKEESSVRLGNENINPSSMTLSNTVDEKLQSHINEKTPWWRIIQVLRSISFFIYTYITVFKVLGQKEVSVVGAQPLYISILVLSGVDVITTSIKAWPKRIWIFWDTENWDSIRYISSIWALIADHELLVDIIPLIANFIVRVYSYRLAEVLADPHTANTLGRLLLNPEQSDFNIQDWANPKYHNYILLLLWGCSALLTIVFHAAHRCYYIGFQHEAPALAATLVIKSLLFAFDLYSNGLFLYIFLVSLGTQLFDNTLYISLLLTAISLSPVVSNISNSLINIPLLYYYERLDKQYSRSTLLKKAFDKVFSPVTTLMVLLAMFYSAVIIYLLVQLQILSPTSPADLIKWNPQSWITFMVGVNLLANYLIGIAFTITYYALRFIGLLGLQLCNALDSRDSV